MNSLESVLLFLMIGLIAGWLAGVLFKGSGFGVLGDIVVGVLGAEMGGWIFGRLGLSTYGFVGAVITALVGAIALLAIVKLVINTGPARTMPVVLLLLACCWSAHAETTVTVNDDKVTVDRNQPGSSVVQQTVPQTVVIEQAPRVITHDAIPGAFEGRIVEVNYSQNWITVQDAGGANRQVLARQDMINSYRVGDYVQIRPTADVAVITIEENPKDFEGEIIRVDIPKNQIMVHDTNGRERRVDLKQGMIGSYKVDDYVRIHLMADLKEAKTIETVRDMERLEGNIVRVDSQGSRMVVRDSHGNERTVLVRQGMITNYGVGNYVRVYQLANHEDVQLVRIIRIS